jgi:carboxymethylenebutenolidase
MAPKPLGKFEKYLIQEFFDDYREGLISRRTFTRRVALITGTMASAASAMLAVGCAPNEVPEATDPIPEPDTPTTAPEVPGEPVPGARSPLSVPEGDPDLETGNVTFPSQGADITGYLARPAADGTYPAVLVCHENRGLTPHIRDVARRFAKEGYAALAVDLLSREGGTDAQDRDAVPGLLTDAGADRHVGDFRAGFEYLITQDFVDPQRIAMNGYCFGGGITWQAATQMSGLKAAAPFYGPAPELSQVPNIQAAVFGVYAEQDERITSGVPELEAALQQAGTVHELKIYPGVNHAFHNDTGDRYVEAQAVEAWNDTLAWFEQHLPGLPDT